MAQIASSMIKPYNNVMVRYGEIFQFAACWSLLEGMRTLIGSYSYLRCASQELLMYAINIGNKQLTVGNETQSNWCRWVANHLRFLGCTPKICGIFQHVSLYSPIWLIWSWSLRVLTLAWLLANDELYSYTYLYVYIYKHNYMYSFVWSVVSISRRNLNSPQKIHRGNLIQWFPLWFPAVLRFQHVSYGKFLGKMARYLYDEPSQMRKGTSAGMLEVGMEKWL